ncbi:MAG: hypothetical protein PHX51_06590 [Clostridia bacterium]|nr:hypothetical protein [Clostridia bacterium]
MSATLESVLSLFVKFVTIGGGLWLIWGVIILGVALKNKNGPELQSGIWQIVGGGMIVAAAQLFNGLVI